MVYYLGNTVLGDFNINIQFCAKNHDIQAITRQLHNRSQKWLLEALSKPVTEGSKNIRITL